MVLSKSHQRYGAVACQIEARGLHTSLVMRVGISQDGLYAFGGVQRGSVEMVAVDLSEVERCHDEADAGGGRGGGGGGGIAGAAWGGGARAAAAAAGRGPSEEERGW